MYLSEAFSKIVGPLQEKKKEVEENIEIISGNARPVPDKLVQEIDEIIFNFFLKCAKNMTGFKKDIRKTLEKYGLDYEVPYRIPIIFGTDSLVIIYNSHRLIEARHEPNNSGVDISEELTDDTMVVIHSTGEVDVLHKTRGQEESVIVSGRTLGNNPHLTINNPEKFLEKIGQNEESETIKLLSKLAENYLLLEKSRGYNMEEIKQHLESCGFKIEADRLRNISLLNNDHYKICLRYKSDVVVDIEQETSTGSIKIEKIKLHNTEAEKEMCQQAEIAIRGMKILKRLTKHPGRELEI